VFGSAAFARKAEGPEIPAAVEAATRKGNVIKVQVRA
jgi:hypothetical protein